MMNTMLVVVIGGSTALPSESTNIGLEQLQATRKPTLSASHFRTYRRVSQSQKMLSMVRGLPVIEFREPRRKRHERVLSGYRFDFLIGILQYAMEGERLIVDRRQVGGR